MPTWDHDGIRFHYLDMGTGAPVVFQHGLGADSSQAPPFFQPLLDPAAPRIRLITLECRAHGKTRPVGPPDKISFATYANDLVALLDRLGIEKTVMGGISMGAGVALHLALRYPERVIALILSRPAWLDQPLPDNLKVYPWLAQLVRQHGPARARERFLQSQEHQDVRKESPDVANSLVNQLSAEGIEETVDRLERIPSDAPNRDRAEWSGIRVHTLLLATRQDPVHPFAYAEALAAGIPGAVLREVTPKSVDVDRHYADVQRELGAFLRRVGVVEDSLADRG